jgi:hypothetical protein
VVERAEVGVWQGGFEAELMLETFYDCEFVKSKTQRISNRADVFWKKKTAETLVGGV